MERSVFILRHFLHLAIELRCGSLVYAAFIGETCLAHSLKHTEHSGCIGVGCVFRHIKRYLNMALGCKVVYLIGLHIHDDLYQAHGVSHVGIMQMKVWMTLQMGDSLAVIR